MSDDTVFSAAAYQQARDALGNEGYLAKYQQSIDDPEAFWGREATRLDWIKPFSKVKQTRWERDTVDIQWFADGTLNVCANCIDRHAATEPDRVAIIWEPDAEEDDARIICYGELLESVSRLANGLLSLDVQRGDVVTIYMPMVPEAAVAMLACARIGAIHSVVFGGFSPEALAGRMTDGRSRVVITADEGRRGGKTVPLKTNVDEAIRHHQELQDGKVVVLQATGANINWCDDRDIWMHELCASVSADCPPAEMNAEDPLFILYTSGSTGKPKGVLHTSGGYLVYAALTHEQVFDYRVGDVFWSAADVGWITGHSYIVYGPLANGATMVMYEGVPNYPDVGRLARIVDKHAVNVLYMAPTAIRSLMAEGDAATRNSSLDSLRLLGSVGEPINPEAWRWYRAHFGRDVCPIVDTWWQTETGGIMISPLPGATDLKPGSATRPMFGIKPALLDDQGREVCGPGSGNLVITDSWPGQMRTVFGDHQRFIDTYFSMYPGHYFTGDGARRDEDGYFWITGRVDDVLNVSGHRMGTAEIESALVAHPDVAEAAVVGYPHEIKGQGIYAYITLNSGIVPSDEKRQALVKWVRHEIGPIATPDLMQFAPGLPKTRSGKIMRRILRKIATNECDQLGDTSTLADPSVVEQLVDNRFNR